MMNGLGYRWKGEDVWWHLYWRSVCEDRTDPSCWLHRSIWTVRVSRSQSSVSICHRAVVIYVTRRAGSAISVCTFASRCLSPNSPKNEWGSIQRLLMHEVAILRGRDVVVRLLSEGRDSVIHIEFWIPKMFFRSTQRLFPYGSFSERGMIEWHEVQALLWTLPE